MENIKIFALGGLDENGKSLYVVEYNEQLYIFDAGLRYPEEAMLGIDVVLPGINYLISRKDSIKGFFITHGHDENMGALPFIIEELGQVVDVYGTNFTILSIKQTANRFKKNISKVRFHVVKESDDFVVNGMQIHSFPVTHSVPESCGFAIETYAGMIVYPGDYILDFSERYPYNTDLTRMVDLAKKPTLALLSESYNATYNGYVAPNNRILQSLNSIADEVKGRLFVAIYGQTIYQLQEIIKCAIENKRKIYLYTKLAFDTLRLLKEQIKSFNIPDGLITNNVFDRDCIVIVSGLGSKVFKRLDEIANYEHTDKSLRLTADDAIVIATPAHAGTELAFARILDDLYHTDASIYNITKDYISMHAGSEDLKTLIQIFKPKYYIPVRGYYNKMIANAKLALELGYNHMNILVYDNGMVANFNDGVLSKQFDKVEANEIMVDGIGIGDIGNVVINDRRKLKQDGVVIVGASFSMQTRKLVAPPKFEFRGLVLGKSENAIIEMLTKSVIVAINEYVSHPGLVDFSELRNLTKERVANVLKSECNKEPMILPVIISL